MLGTARIGAAFVPLDPTHAPEQISHIQQDLGLKTCLVAEAYRGREADWLDGPQPIAIATCAETGPLPEPPAQSTSLAIGTQAPE